jgi:hypothetical protein
MTTGREVAQDALGKMPGRPYPPSLGLRQIMRAPPPEGLSPEVAARLRESLRGKVEALGAAARPTPAEQIVTQFDGIVKAYARAAQQLAEAYRPIAEALASVPIPPRFPTDEARHRPGDPEW